jgi:cytochrome c-type biogenesis protein CcsB
MIDYQLFVSILLSSAALVFYVLAFVFSAWEIGLRRAPSGEVVADPPALTYRWPGKTAIILTICGLAFETGSIIARAIASGHGPFSSTYEFALAFSWGTIVLGLYFQWRYRVIAVGAIGLIVAILLLLLTRGMSPAIVPLVPALQQGFLLTTHVAAAVIAYGTFAIGFGAAALYLVQRLRSFSWLPSAQLLDRLSYHTVVIGFPFLTLLIILGALWAYVAWGRYWGWDPKETASLVTWLLYANYLHARVLRGWRGTKAAVLLVAGFAAVLFTFFGNFIFAGLHSYG